jgi:2,3-diketo-5-methylthio-1-phosphopentane phosphatase
MKENMFFDFTSLNPDEWNIICDFDGTITPFDVTDAILQQFAPKAWQDIEAEWLRGEITAHQCMERQIAMINAPVRRLDAFLDCVPITDGFKDFVHFCQAQGLRMLIVSDGMDYTIKRILAKHSLFKVPVIANRLLCRDNGRYMLEFPYGTAGCASGVCKCAVAKSSSCKTLLIGDGRSDCCLAGSASFILAKEGKELERHCLTKAYPHKLFNNFYDVLANFEKIPQMPEVVNFNQLVQAQV